MDNWREAYANKIVTADVAVNQIKSGDRMVLMHAVGEPYELVDAMVKNKDAYEKVEIVHMVPMGKAEYCKPEMKGHFYHNSFFLGGSTREHVNSGAGMYTPVNLSDVPGLFDDYLPPDVCLFQVTPPNKDGFCSYGVSCDFSKHAAETAKLRIAEINDQYPFVGGDNLIHISKIDWMVEVSHPVIELPAGKIGEVEQAIGNNIASLIEDGDCLQLGIGSIPDAVLAALGDKKHLGIHSEMMGSGVVDLVKKGVIDCTKKTLHPGKIVATFIMGNQALYDFVNNNDMVELYPCDYVNNPAVIALNEHLVSINSCVQVDFTGQVASESMGATQFSGSGGQCDFAQGADKSKGGKGIIAITSTASKGKISRIVPQLDPGAIVTTPRNLVNYVVTEHGIAQLKGKNTRDRARALIQIAHPDFRDHLKEEFEKMFHCGF
ncbi:MAG: acetyl-CoA hydrolase/transferase family protein [Lachnospiraceae bacterium]|nr:acetyl-CoA hydrolase/transferase family protein [Lachnospiraceae bacterium]